MDKKVGIVLVNYKMHYLERFLAECRDSLRAQTYPRELTQVYIADNGTDDDTQAYLKEHYPEAVSIPRVDGNYAAGNNAGLRRAYDDGCDLFVIVNMDVRLKKDWLEELARAVEANPGVGQVQSKMLLYPQTREEWKKPFINSIGNVMQFLGFGFTQGYKEPDRYIDGYPEIRGYASGCSFITTREVLEKIGGYDEEYYMYHDDIEMSWRVKLAGYKVLLAPKSVMYHKYEFNRSVRMLYYMERNRYLAILHYYTIRSLFLILPALLVMEAGMLFYSVINGWIATKLRVYAYFLRPSTWRKIIRKRKMVAKLRVVRDFEVVKDFSGSVLFQEIENPALKYIANPFLKIYWAVVKRFL